MQGQTLHPDHSQEMVLYPGDHQTSGERARLLKPGARGYIWYCLNGNPNSRTPHSTLALAEDNLLRLHT